MRISGSSEALETLGSQSNGAVALARLAERLPPLLSVIAGMVDLTSFYTLGNIFTAHVTGNLVVATAALAGGEPLKLAQVLAIPVFMLALAGVWLIARISGRQSVGLVRLLLLIQLILLVGVLVVSALTRPSTDAHGLMAGVAAMMAVAAMACQFALLRLAVPGAISTAVMTGNLTNSVLLSMEWLLRGRSRMTDESRQRLTRSLWLLAGFLSGCVIASVAVCMFADWAWVLPVVLAAGALLLTA